MHNRIHCHRVALLCSGYGRQVSAACTFSEAAQACSRALHRPVLHDEEGMIGASCPGGQLLLHPDMLPYAILQALSPLACVHFTRSPLHATMTVLLILPPVSSVHIAIAVVHAARTMLQVVLPCTCSRLLRLAISA